MLSDNIKYYRKQKGYTQETLAQALNIVRQTVSKWEKGYSVPDADMLEKMSEILEVPVNELLGTPSENKDQSTEIEKLASQLAILNDQIAREAARKKKAKKINLIIAAVIVGVLFIGCAVLFISFPIDSLIPGDMSHVEVRQTPSQMYSQSEIENAIEVIRNDFEDWKGCTMTLIYYAGDDICAEETKNRGVQTLVLYSDFRTGNVDGNDGLNSNHTYRRWNWILIKDEGGRWKHIDHGY